MQDKRKVRKTYSEEFKLLFFKFKIDKILIVSLLASGLVSCRSEPAAGDNGSIFDKNKAPKLTSDVCKDPDLSKLAKGEALMLCNGELGEGTYEAKNSVCYNPAPNAWDIRYGVTVGATTGKLKANCRNMAHLATYDKDFDTVADVFDTIDDYNGSTGNTFPITNPWSDDEYLCGFNDPSDPTWERVTTTPATSGSNSVYKDKITNLNWTRGSSVGTKDWSEAEGGGGNGAIEYCDGLSHGGISTWRLPTQKELQAAYAHGIHDLDSAHTATNHLGDLDQYFWSSTTRSDSTTYAWRVYLNDGHTYGNTKTGISTVLCVSE